MVDLGAVAVVIFTQKSYKLFTVPIGWLNIQHYSFSNDLQIFDV